METSQLKLALRNIFNKVDPMGIFFETNVDEYDSEIDELMNRLSDFSDIQVVEKELHAIFKKSFSPVETSGNTLISELASKITTGNLGQKGYRRSDTSDED